MIRSPLQIHRTRVPAIPPRMSPARRTFSFCPEDFQYGGSLPEWQAFLKAINVPSKKLAFSETSMRRAVEFAKDQGMKVQYKMEGHFSEEVIITLDRPKPRISAKLAATFPWKLRKYLKS